MSDGFDLSAAENSTFKDIQELLYGRGFLEDGKSIPIVHKEKTNLEDGQLRGNFGAYAHEE
jgi:hypothetical protein